MDFPRLVFKCPGTQQRPGGTFSHKPVADGAEFDAALADGWFATLPDAIAGPIPAPVPAEVDADKPPTRDELEQKASDLGLKFDGRTTDRKLAEMISHKLAE